MNPAGRFNWFGSKAKIIMNSILSFSATANMMEATNHEVELGGAEPEIIELLVEFVYTARYEIR